MVGFEEVGRGNGEEVAGVGRGSREGGELRRGGGGDAWAAAGAGLLVLAESTNKQHHPLASLMIKEAQMRRNR